MKAEIDSLRKDILNLQNMLGKRQS